jgi:hypothetical protein
VLAEMTFTLCQFEGKSTLFIGGLQGAKAHVPHELIQGDESLPRSVPETSAGRSRHDARHRLPGRADCRRQ